MKKLLLIITLLTTQFAFAIENSLEKPNLSSEFAQLDKIEAAAKIGDQDLENLLISNPEIIEGVNLSTVSNVSAVRGGDLPGGIPAIVWGFCCCVFGLALVYFQTDNDKEQVKKAAIGCVVSTILWVGVSLLSGGFGGGYSYYY